jgi:hypothetical protein
MNQINLLQQTLKPLLGWHGARLNFLALFLISLLRVKTINLSSLAIGFRSQAKTDSSYKRLQRFLRHFDLDYAQLAKVFMALMDIPQPWVLSIDRTEWSLGLTRINILMLGVVHNGVAIPLVWTMLDKKGNSHSDERMDLLDRFQEIFPDVAIDFLSGDREFVGKEWLSYLLLKPSIPFRLRIRESDKIGGGARKLRTSVVFAHLKIGESQVLSGRRQVWGRAVYIAGLRLENGELLVVIGSESPETMISDYAQRWGIETLFGMFKTRGFCLESTHVVSGERLSKLLALMSLALCWAIKVGEWRHEHEPLKIKKHGRLAQSIFRYGFDFLRSVVLDLDLNHDDFLRSLLFLSCT